MEGDVRVLLVALFYDLLIFGGCFVGFLYLRQFRGDHRERGVPVLRAVRSARGPLHQSQAVPRLSVSAPASPRATHDDRIPNGFPRYAGVGGWRVQTSPQHVDDSPTKLTSPQNVSTPARYTLPTPDPPTPDPPTPDPEFASHIPSELIPLSPKCRNSELAYISAITPRASRDAPRATYRSPQYQERVGDSFVSSTVTPAPTNKYPQSRRRSFSTPREGARSTFCANPSTPQPEEGRWAWFRVLLAMEDQRFHSTDVQFYLLFLKTCQTITLQCSIVALLIVLPVNVSCPMKSGGEGWLDRAAAENVTANDWRIWVLMACTWIYSFISYFHIYSFWVKIGDPEFLSNVDSFNPEAYTIMIKGIHRTEISPTILCDHFEKLFPSKVVSASLVLDFSSLVVAKRALAETLRKLSEVEINSSAIPSIRPLLNNHHQNHNEAMNRCHTGIDDPAVPSRHAVVEVAQNRCISNNTEIGYWRSLAETRSIAVDKVLSTPPTSNAGIGFLSFSETAPVTQCIDDPRVTTPHYEWICLQAPPPQDIIWMNIHISSSQRWMRCLSLNLLLVLASIILTSSAMLTNALLPLAENMEKALHEADFLKLSVTGWGAPFILFLINSVCLPVMVQGTANCIGYWRVSKIDSAVLHGNVIFLVLNTVIFPTIGNGSIGALLARIYQTQIQKWNISLGRLIVGQSGSFALRYLLNGCFLSSASQLLQLAQLSWFGVLQTLGKDAEAWQFDFGYSYAFCLSIFFMVMAFSVVVPLVLPFGCLFFTLKYYVDKYNFLFGVWRVEQETAGAVVAIAVRYLLGALAFLQFVMSGYFVTFGLRPSSSELGGIEMTQSKGLILGGTFLLVVSLVSAVLLGGHSMTSAKMRRGVGNGARLTIAQEEALRQAFTHPYQSEQLRLLAINESKHSEY